MFREYIKRHVYLIVTIPSCNVMGYKLPAPREHESRYASIPLSGAIYNPSQPLHASLNFRHTDINWNSTIRRFFDPLLRHLFQVAAAVARGWTWRNESLQGRGTIVLVQELQMIANDINISVIWCINQIEGAVSMCISESHTGNAYIFINIPYMF